MGRYRYDPLSGQDYIRLATIHPAKFMKDDIVISFHASPFPNDILSYEALSYVWGSKKGCMPIHVSRVDPDISNYSIKLPFPDRDVYSIYHLMCRQWFERLWIRQEILLVGPEAVIMCGLYQVKWSSFRRGLACNNLKPITVPDFTNQLVTRMNFHRAFTFQLKNNNLINLKYNYNNTRCLDPRDRLYAVLALLNDEDKAIIPSPDYTQPYDKLYTAVVRNWIEYYGSLDILYQCQLQDSICPSWVPDWSKPDDRFDILLPYLCRSPFIAWCKFPQPSVLRVMGVSKCAVSEYHQFPQMSIYNDTRLKQIRTLLLKVDLEEQHTAEDYTRLLTYDRFANIFYPPDFRFPDFEEAKQCVEFIMSGCDINDVNNKDFISSPGVRKFLQVASVVGGHLFIRCTGGYIGIAPASAQPGDEVYTLLGCSSLILLRPRGNNKFQVIGPCFVPGLTYGEALLGPLPVNSRAIPSYDKRFENYTPAFRDISSGEISYKDPRLKSLPVDLEDFRRRRLRENALSDLYIEPDIFRQCGVDLKCIDLV